LARSSNAGGSREFLRKNSPENKRRKLDKKKVMKASDIEKNYSKAPYLRAMQNVQPKIRGWIQEQKEKYFQN
jgi:hypothetical protein